MRNWTTASQGERIAETPNSTKIEGTADHAPGAETIENGSVRSGGVAEESERIATMQDAVRFVEDPPSLSEVETLAAPEQRWARAGDNGGSEEQEGVLRRRRDGPQSELDSSRAQLARMEEEHAAEIQALKAKHETETTRLRDDLSDLRKELHAKEKVILDQHNRMKRVQVYNRELTDDLERLYRERDEARKTKSTEAERALNEPSETMSEKPQKIRRGTNSLDQIKSNMSNLVSGTLSYLSSLWSFRASKVDHTKKKKPTQNAAAEDCGLAGSESFAEDTESDGSDYVSCSDNWEDPTSSATPSLVSDSAGPAFREAPGTRHRNGFGEARCSDGVHGSPLDDDLGVSIYERSRRIHCRASLENRRSFARRTSVDTASAYSDPAFRPLVQSERFRDWASSLRRLDPRYQILKYFDDVARDGGILSRTMDGGGDQEEADCEENEEGASLEVSDLAAIVTASRRFSGCGGDAPRSPDDSSRRGSTSASGQRRQQRRCSAVLHPELQSPLLRLFNRAGVFTVWRPCSLDAIRAMMTGKATGKGLDVKGKSARRGDMSGYVPFVQIHEERHKAMVRAVPSNARMRVFYATRKARDVVVDYLERFTGTDGVDLGLVQIDELASADCWGLECPQFLFWDACILQLPIEREAGSNLDTGRPSEPAFQDMNLEAARCGDGTNEHGKEDPGNDNSPRAVLWQSAPTDMDGCVDGDPLDPRTLLMAYEEKGRVLPVVSDFDCFIVGTRGVKYDSALPAEQVELVRWCVSQTESILDRQKRCSGPNDKTSQEVPQIDDSWTTQWLEVLKRVATDSDSGGAKGAPFIPVPRFGFGDPTSYAIMKHAIGRLECGAVRHGAECFNYKFPQEIDDQFLVVSDTLPGKVPWKYVTEPELRELLCHKIDEGFAFPLNPKWVLCDPGWKDVYNKLMCSTIVNVQRSMDVWFPPHSGVREHIENISARHSHGFVSRRHGESAEGSTEAMDLAELQLRRYLILRRCKQKLNVVLTIRRLSRGGLDGDDDDDESE